MESLSCLYRRSRLLGWVRMSRTERKRVLLLGATGLLGSHLAAVLPRCFETLAPKPRVPLVNYEPAGVYWLSSYFDATNFETLNDVLEEACADFIVNCVAITPESPLADDFIACITVNSLFPHYLAKVARNYDSHLIHISTDGVFSGKRGNYKEADLPDPPDLYSRSKLLGEVSDDHCLTLRTTFYGPSPTRQGLVEWLLNHRGSTVKGYKNYIFSGLSMASLARVIISIIERPVSLTGLYHVGGPAVSKYDLLVMLSDKLQLHVDVEAEEYPFVDRSLDSQRFWRILGLDMPQTESMLNEILLQVISGKILR